MSAFEIKIETLSLRFQAETGKLLIVKSDTETRIGSILEIKTIRDWPLDVESLYSRPRPRQRISLIYVIRIYFTAKVPLESISFH